MKITKQNLTSIQELAIKQYIDEHPRELNDKQFITKCYIDAFCVFLEDNDIKVELEYPRTKYTTRD